MPILVRHPPVDVLLRQQPTYPQVGATAGDLPAGYRHVDRRARVGRGPEDFARCATALMTWEVHRAAGLDVRASSAPAQVGAVVSQRLGVGPVGVVAPCRVVAVVDQADRRGFAYGTLPGHPETGEESFVVSRDATGDVWFEIRSFSRPSTALGRAVAPVARVVQDLVVGRYVAAARRVAARG